MSRSAALAENFDEQAARERWERDSALQEEFAGSGLVGYLAFEKAQAAGRVRICGGGVVPGYPSSAARTRAFVDADAVERAAFDRFERDPALRAEFAASGWPGYRAFCLADAAGRVRIHGRGRSNNVHTEPASSAPKPSPSSDAEAEKRVKDRDWQRARWDSSTGLRDAFPDFETFYQRCLSTS